MVESMKKEDDGGLALWMQQNAGKAKLCPHTCHYNYSFQGKYIVIIRD
jgi:hypothetical protein